MQCHLSPALRPVNPLNGVFPFAGGLPAHAALRTEPGTPGGHGNPVRDNKARVKADAELTDQLRILGLVTGQGREELLGPGFSNGA